MYDLGNQPGKNQPHNHPPPSSPSHHPAQGDDSYEFEASDADSSEVDSHGNPFDDTYGHHVGIVYTNGGEKRRKITNYKRKFGHFPEWKHDRATGLV